MAFEFHHLDKWAYANLDLIEESLESNKKAVILVSGASSSGKSFSAEFLMELLKKNGHRAYTISLDQYNVGLSAIIPEKVNKNYYGGFFPNLKEIESRIKKVIYDIPFDKKYAPESLKLIKKEIIDLVDKDELDIFLSHLNEEWQVLNFDEPTVYNLKEAASDIKALLNEETIDKKLYSKVVSERVDSNEKINGLDYDVILVEGIYALEPTLY